MDMIIVKHMKKRGYHGMESQQASLKKKEGHKREYIRLSQLGEGAEIVPGNGKVDIIRPDEKTESVKGGGRTQWALYSEERINESKLSDEGKDAFSNWINFLPKNKEEYLKTPKHFSQNTNVVDLYNVFKDNPMELIKYFCGYDVIDYYVLMDKRDNTQMVINKNEFFDKIENSIKRVYTTPGGKLSIAGGNKDVLLFELELRKGKNSHRGVLFVSTLKQIIDLFK